MWTRNRGSKVMRKRGGNGRFKRATVENTFGFKVTICADCRGFNTHDGARPDACKQCGASPLRDLAEVQVSP